MESLVLHGELIKDTFTLCITQGQGWPSLLTCREELQRLNCEESMSKQ